MVYIESNIRKDLEDGNLLGEKHESESQTITFYLIMRVLMYQQGEKFTLTPDEIIEKYQNLLMEITLEKISKKAGINFIYDKPNLDNFLLNRNISMDEEAKNYLESLDLVVWN